MQVNGLSYISLTNRGSSGMAIAVAEAFSAEFTKVANEIYSDLLIVNSGCAVQKDIRFNKFNYFPYQYRPGKHCEILATKPSEEKTNVKKYN